MAYSVSELARSLDLSFEGDGNRQVIRVSSWRDADEYSLIFTEEDKRREILPAVPNAACVIAPEAVPSWNTLISRRPKLDFARASQLLQPRLIGTGIHSASSEISPEARIGERVDLGQRVSVLAGAQIGKGCILREGVVVGEHCVVGEQCILHPHVVLYPGVRIGNRVTVHAGAVLGSDGFGYVFDGQSQVKFPQVGGLVIEDDVEIGANTTIDRGSLGVTRIRRGAKIDNLVQIAHNVEIGQGVVIAAQTGISGSTVIEDYAVIGGQVGFGDHARVQSGAVIGSKAGVLPGKIVRGGEVYWGVPIRPLAEYKRLNALFGRLPEMKAEIGLLKKALLRIEETLRRLQDK
jgi:UDP-3-O-[3-hydroxymyristoyl] glucosamine N-acyltransferase